MTENKNNSTAYRLQLRERVVETAMRAFAARGIRSVKMDDVARKMGISKRTLYELYENKEELLLEGVMRYQRQRVEKISEIVAHDNNVMDILLHAYRLQLDELKLTSLQFYADLERYPRVLRKLEENKQVNNEKFLSFLQRGVDEGYFRGDVDFGLVSLMFEAIGHYVMSRQLYLHYDVEKIYKNMVFTSLRGICTERGVKVLDEAL